MQKRLGEMESKEPSSEASRNKFEPLMPLQTAATVLDNFNRAVPSLVITGAGAVGLALTGIDPTRAMN